MIYQRYCCFGQKSSLVLRTDRQIIIWNKIAQDCLNGNANLRKSHMPAINAMAHKYTIKEIADGLSARGG